jgi:trans-aconitate 2-methyltransferase
VALEWDAASYEELADPMTRWGEEFLGGLELRGDEVVVDAGCGTGRVTELLLRRLPEGRVVAVDASREMVEAAGRRFAGEERVRVLRQDLLELDLGEEADVIFSTATFHWIPDHGRLFRALARNLKPGGTLAAQCGGAGNVSRVGRALREVMKEEPFRAYFEGWQDTKHYPAPEEEKALLEGNGFCEVETHLVEKPTPFEGVEALARYLEAVILRAHLPRLPEEKRRPFAEAVAARMAREEGLEIDYVRLNMLARKKEAESNE